MLITVKGIDLAFHLNIIEPEKVILVWDIEYHIPLDSAVNMIIVLAFFISAFNNGNIVDFTMTNFAYGLIPPFSEFNILLMRRRLRVVLNCFVEKPFAINVTPFI